SSEKYFDVNYTQLDSGNFSFKAYAQDSLGNVNETEEREVGVNLNTAPNIPVIAINSTDGSNKTLQNLNCYATLSDDDSDSLNVTVKWYKNGVLNLTRYYNNSYSSGNAFNAILGNGNTTKGQNWSCSVMIYDGQAYSGWGNSSNLTVLNTLPIVTLSSPSNWDKTTNRTPEFTWVGSDDDSDAMTYDFNITDYKFSGASSCTDSRLAGDLNGFNYIPASDLMCLHDNGYYYKWRVRANDGEGDGSWSSDFVVNITASISILMIQDEVSFSALTPLDNNNDTIDNNPEPFVLENNGNSLINVSVNSSALWNTQQTESDYYQFKVDNYSGEGGAFTWLSSVVDWFNFPLSGNVVAIDRLNYSDVKDSAEIDVRVELPPNEDPGAKGAIVVFTGGLAE
ncbi:MAG: hypothetical protein WC548_00005, partial [Candidatus Pacearchaeota archaeon]